MTELGIKTSYSDTVFLKLNFGELHIEDAEKMLGDVAG